MSNPPAGMVVRVMSQLGIVDSPARPTSLIDDERGTIGDANAGKNVAGAAAGCSPEQPSAKQVHGILPGDVHHRPVAVLLLEFVPTTVLPIGVDEVVRCDPKEVVMTGLTRITMCLLLAPLVLFACGGISYPKPRGPKVDPRTLERALIQTHLAPYDLRSIGEESIDFAARFVFQASFFNGRTLTASGTLTQSSPHSDEFTYDATPQDHLVVRFADAAKTTVELFVTGFDGDFGDFDAEDFNVFLDFHRDLRFRLKNATLDVTVESQSGNTDDITRAFEWTYEGWLTRGDDTIRLQAHDQGQDQSVFDPPFSNRRKEDNITGLFASSFGETSVDARLTFANDFSQEGSDFSTNEDFLTATTLRSSVFARTSIRAEDLIRLEKGRVELSFVNDRPGEVSEAEGTFFRDEDAIATLAIIDDADGRPLVVVVLEDGRVVRP